MYFPHWKDLVAFRSRNVRNTQSTSEMISVGHMLHNSSVSSINDCRPRHSTLIGVPLSIINSGSRQDSLRQSTGFIYNEEICQEVYYQSANEIPILEENLCLWIDVPTVN